MCELAYLPFLTHIPNDILFKSDETWNLSKAVCQLLSSFSIVCNSKFLEHSINFIGGK